MKIKRLYYVILLVFFAGLMLCMVVPTYAATYIVADTNDSGPGSLRQAIIDANANPGADTIEFTVTGTITLSGSLPTVTGSLTITGPGAESLTVDAGSNGYIFNLDGQDNHIYGLTLTGGSAQDGGAIKLLQSDALTIDSCIISDNTASRGGGIYINSSTLTIQNSTISGNEATTGEGGGISIEGSSIVTLGNVTISSNTAASSGGGIYNNGNSMFITNSTINGNGPVTNGGGIYNSNTSATFTNVTISDNTANVGGGISNASSTLVLTNVTIYNNKGGISGRDIYNSGSVTFKNTIVANNLGSGNSCGNSGGTFTSLGYNLDSGSTCGFDQAGDLTDTDPLLGPLYDNGGATKTHALLLNSPAIDNGTESGRPSTGQRGFSRSQDGDGDGTVMCDMGAFEVFTGTVDLPQTGQTGCWDENGNPCTCGAPGCGGHDGSIQAGVAWPSPRFVVNGDCVIDNLTGLMWVKTPLTILRTWTTALTHANNLTLCGYDDWRLPNINELESLINAEEPDPAAWLNTQEFTNVQANYYWSSTTSIEDTTRAWYVDMGDGKVEYSNVTKTDFFYAWPVRAGQQDKSDTDYAANPWKTGQTEIYDPVDDGAFQRGIVIPSSVRFTDNGDGTVTDNLTGLMWLKDANCMETHYSSTWSSGLATWQEALDIVSGINDGTYAECGAGYTDWHLPNRKELHSLTDFSQSNPALPSGHPFENVELGPSGWQYLSSTTYSNSADEFWGLNMATGTMYGISKTGTNTNWIWPVRGILSDNSNTGNGVSGVGGGGSGGCCFISTAAHGS